MNYLKSFRNLCICLAVFSGAVYFVGCSEKADEVVKDPLETVITVSADGKTVSIKDLGRGIGTTTWTADKTYILENFVFVNEGQILTIEPGTIIKGKPGQNADASALVVARGGKIIADGTAEKPIIFTALADDVNNTQQPEDTQSGLWGGLIVLGKAILNTIPNEKAIEGIPTTEKRGIYGGSDDADNSGILRYVSVRHGGTSIGSGNEINGITFGGVGSATTIEHIESVYTADDGIEIFGGSPKIKYLVTAFNDDDGLDYDEGFHGYIQHGLVWLSNQSKTVDNGGEFSGGTSPKDGKPYSKPTISNITFIGGGNDATSGRAIILKDNSGGFIHNCIFTEFGKGIEIEDDVETVAEDCFKRLKEGDISLRGNIFWKIGTTEITENYIMRYDVKEKKSFPLYSEAFQKGNNLGGNPGLTISYIRNSGTDPVPKGGGVGLNVELVENPWFDKSTYRGGFQPDNNNHWLKGWSYLVKHDYLVK